MLTSIATLRTQKRADLWHIDSVHALPSGPKSFPGRGFPCREGSFVGYLPAQADATNRPMNIGARAWREVQEM